jgi:hypothetical protein
MTKTKRPVCVCAIETCGVCSHGADFSLCHIIFVALLRDLSSETQMAKKVRQRRRENPEEVVTNIGKMRANADAVSAK